MAELVHSICASPDGYAAKPGGVFSPPPWSDAVEAAWSAAALARAGHLLCGRVNVAFNRDVWSAAEMARLKREATGHIFAFGRATLAQTLWSLDLVDEFWMMVTPAIFGDGAPVFHPGRPARTMRPMECRALDVGSVILRYRRASGDDRRGERAQHRHRVARRVFFERDFHHFDFITHASLTQFAGLY